MAYVAVCLHYVEKCLPDALTLKGERLEVGTRYLPMFVCQFACTTQTSVCLILQLSSRKERRQVPTYICVCVSVCLDYFDKCLHEEKRYVPTGVCVCLFLRIIQEKYEGRNLHMYVCLFVCFLVKITQSSACLMLQLSSRKERSRYLPMFVCVCVCLSGLCKQMPPHVCHSYSYSTNEVREEGKTPKRVGVSG